MPNYSQVKIFLCSIVAIFWRDCSKEKIIPQGSSSILSLKNFDLSDNNLPQPSALGIHYLSPLRMTSKNGRWASVSTLTPLLTLMTHPPIPCKKPQNLGHRLLKALGLSTMSLNKSSPGFYILWADADTWGRCRTQVLLTLLQLYLAGTLVLRGAGPCPRQLLHLPSWASCHPPTFFQLFLE